MSRLDVSWTEIVEALPPEAQELLLAEVNSTRREEGRSLVEDVSDLPEEEVAAEINGGPIGTTDIIINTLEARSREYIHIRDLSLHGIIELTPDQETEEPVIGHP